MAKEVLNEREFELINIVGAKLAQNQRNLSRRLNLSLGMTNMLLKRLVTKGYVRINQLDHRKVQYLLTPKGFMEKTQRSIKYTVKTLNSISLIKERLKVILEPFYQNGERFFYVVGKSDLSYLIDAVFREEGFADCRIHHTEEYPTDGFDGMVLVCKEEKITDGPVQKRRINLIYELAKQEGVHA